MIKKLKFPLTYIVRLETELTDIVILSEILLQFLKGD